jgi:hypothetical protein
MPEPDRPKLTMRGFLEEVVPALNAAGLSLAAIRAVSDETRRRMGEGGVPAEWITTMGHVVAETGNETAMTAFILAIDVWTGKLPPSPPALP